MADEPMIALCTAPDGDVAARLARGLVEKKLAACVNVLPGLRSFYTWENAVQDDAEVQLLIKTRGGRAEEVKAFLAEHHPYDVPEVLFLPIADGSKPYLDWMREETAG